MAKTKSTKKPKRPAKKPATRRPTRKVAAKKSANSSVPRQSWLDAKLHKPLIGQYAQRLESFLQTVADGTVDDGELRAQEGRLIKAMKVVEPKLNAAQHGQVTQLLCELAAYDVMQMLHALQQSRPTTKFVG